MSTRQPDIRLYLTSEHDCAYLKQRRARNLVTDPKCNSPELYSALAPLGFRRSGDYLYRPHCQICKACVSLRLPVAEHRPNRSMRRLLIKNQDLDFTRGDPGHNDEYFQLYRHYLAVRHPGGGMDQSAPEDFHTFLTSAWCNTRFYEARNQEKLVAVAVTDEVSDGLSAVYTFFDPRLPERGLGTWVILKQIQTAHAESLSWLYLGYWIEGCKKMAYKTRFRPHELRIADGIWQRYP